MTLKFTGYQFDDVPSEVVAALTANIRDFNSVVDDMNEKQGAALAVVAEIDDQFEAKFLETAKGLHDLIGALELDESEDPDGTAIEALRSDLYDAVRDVLDDELRSFDYEGKEIDFTFDESGVELSWWLPSSC